MDVDQYSVTYTGLRVISVPGLAETLVFLTLSLPDFLGCNSLGSNLNPVCPSMPRTLGVRIAVNELAIIFHHHVIIAGNRLLE